MNYGTPPEDLGKYDIECPEMMLYQYLPIKMNHQSYLLKWGLPKNLHWMYPLHNQITYDDNDYVYLTAKRSYATPDNKGNRKGWHTDGFMSEDINYIWYDCIPTEFAIQEFSLTEDHNISMREMEEQVDIRNIVTYPNRHLLKLTPENVHRVSESNMEGFRTFVKISVSKHKYNLKGNSHNYLFDYEWDMQERFVERNCPIGG